MRLLIAADIFPPESGGPATYCVTLANELTKRGDEVKIVSLNSSSDASHVSCNMYHVTKRNKLLKYLLYIYLLWKHGKNIDVIYAMGPVNAGLPALIAAKLRRKKFVVKVVGDYAWEIASQKYKVESIKPIDEFQKHGGCGLKISVLRFVERFVVRKADQVIVPSKYLKGIVEGWGAKKDNVELICNEVEFISADPIKHDGEKWLVSVGRLVPWKGMDTLIEVISDISEQFPESGWKLKIVGDGPEMNNLKKKVIDNNLTDIVQLTGNLSKEKTLAYMASADVFILNSAYEGFSHVLIEAHNQGVPVLASRVGGNLEVVAYPALFEYNNKKEIEEKVLLNSNVDKGESIPHRFGLTDMVTDTIRVLENKKQFNNIRPLNN
ncbi:MAG: glycosyltransferase family 4 protein [Candidatus Magasanikbacteria bacterium]|nr:glycosyltransferase family 4 protein [Candidatus Magasanikbacteria bacterium]